jgi:predicted nuclease of restriction endonuclease-like (RecB) superfamily
LYPPKPQLWHEREKRSKKKKEKKRKMKNIVSDTTREGVVDSFSFSFLSFAGFDTFLGSKK